MGDRIQLGGQEYGIEEHNLPKDFIPSIDIGAIAQTYPEELGPRVLALLTILTDTLEQPCIVLTDNERTQLPDDQIDRFNYAFLRLDPEDPRPLDSEQYLKLAQNILRVSALNGAITTMALLAQTIETAGKQQLSANIKTIATATTNLFFGQVEPREITALLKTIGFPDQNATAEALFKERSFIQPKSERTRYEYAIADIQSAVRIMVVDMFGPTALTEFTTHLNQEAEDSEQKAQFTPSPELEEKFRQLGLDINSQDYNQLISLTLSLLRICLPDPREYLTGTETYFANTIKIARAVRKKIKEIRALTNNNLWTKPINLELALEAIDGTEDSQVQVLPGGRTIRPNDGALRKIRKAFGRAIKESETVIQREVSVEEAHSELHVRAGYRGMTIPERLLVAQITKYAIKKILEMVAEDAGPQPQV